MKVTVLQTDIKWNCPEANYASALRLISENPNSDLYVLPEMWTTGFEMASPHANGLQSCDDSLQWMKGIAMKNSCALCGSLSIKEGSTNKNRLYFVYPNGSVCHYDKRHLFSYAGEDKSYMPGNERVIAKYKGVRFLLQICYDLRFPVWMRNKGDYDAIIIVANWPSSRICVWDILTKARAIENQCYVIASNRTGQDPFCRYEGHSAVIDAKGQLSAQATGNGEQAITAEINMDDLIRFREKFPVLNDSDIFKI